MSNRITRIELLERALLTGGGVAVGGIVISALPDFADSKASPAQDAEILNFALLLEYVQAGLYADALARKSLTGERRQFAKVVGEHERTHIAFIRKALGSKARKPPKLDFGDDTATPESFTDVALKLEDLGVAAYNAQAPNLTKPALAAAGRIVSVEARHASWVRTLSGQIAAPQAVDKPITARQLENGLHELGLRA